MPVLYIYQKNTVLDKDNLFEVFDKLLAYFPNLSTNSSIKSKICKFADKCLEKALFEKAKWYYISLVKIDINYHLAYWGILLASNKCMNAHELSRLPIPLDNFPEYTLAIKYSKGDEKSENFYSDVLSEQRNYLKKRKKPQYILMFLFAIIVAAILMIWVIK